MVRNFLLTLSFMLVASFAFAQTALSGKVIDTELNEELIGANVSISKNGVFVTGASTDIDGNYKVNIDPGTYDVEVSYTGFSNKKITDVLVSAGQNTTLDFGMEEGVVLGDIIVVGYKVPLIEVDKTTSGGVVTSDQIRNLPTRNVNAIAAQTAGASSSDEGEAISIKGSRSNATDYYIDGIRVRGSMIPESEIEQLQVITGGIGARYGDVTGGIISITTKGPSQKFSGGVEAETSEYLDAFGQSILGANVSGPILKNKAGQSVLGFRISGRYRHLEDDDPSAVGVYRATDETLATLAANPVIAGTELPTAREIGNEGVELLKTRPFESRQRLDATAKLDARLSDNIDVSFTGTYANVKNQFTPGRLSNADEWSLYNAQNNPFNLTERFRGNIRFRHKLGGGNAAEGDAAKSSAVSNFQYTIQAGFERNTVSREDQRHQDRLFDYGFIGNTTMQWNPEFEASFVDQVLVFNHAGYTPVTTGFSNDPTINPGLVAYNNGITDILNEDDLVAKNGATSNVATEIYDNYANINAVYNSFRKEEGNLATGTISSSFDLHPGGSDKGVHSIQLGLIYEQRVDRVYSIAPRGLWTLADFNDNRHILPGVDTTNIIGMIEGPDGVMIPQYNTLINEDDDLLFYKSIRALTGNDVHEFVNVDALTPDQLSLEMFSPKELTDQRLISYYGYDHLGDKVGTDVTFDDFFTATKSTPFGEIRAFPVAPNQPNYFAGYIQDKFQYKDIIFRIGVRVDRYDANTKVLKDPLSLYDIISARDFYQSPDITETRPNTIGDEFKVYVTSPDDNTVKAFRDGSQWYFADGSQANDGNIIFGTGPRYVQYSDDRAGGSWIKERDFDPNNSFEDYKPQVNVMPRLAFSFPISKEANFFAHYDILVQRPPGTDNIATALDYFYFGDADRTPEENPNLKPEKTISYEIGFKQKLSNSSAMTVSAYYKELRDMIQIRDFLYLPADLNVGQYVGFDNLDFGTTKGFTFQYDLRRTNNVTLQAAYTLAFADGTGSDSESSRNLGSRGNIRNLFPLNFDERHRFNVSLDYRYDSKAYNGPVLFEKDIFADAGINIQTIAVSGRPYTATLVPDQYGGTGTEGDLNGARLPWNFTVNARIDKDFTLYKPVDRPAVGLNVYLRVQNVFDRRNLLDVYSATGSAYDDGYLNSANGQATLQEQERQGLGDPYLAHYSWGLLNSGNFTLPRRIYLGAILQF